MGDVSPNVFQFFGSLYKSPYLSDMWLRTADEEIPAHKIVLSSRNKTMAKKIKNIGTSQKLCVNYKDLNGAFQKFVEFLYTNKVNSKNIDKKLLIIASEFKDKVLKKICEDYFIQQLNEENVADLLNVSIAYHCKLLHEKANHFIANISAKIVPGVQNVCTGIVGLPTKSSEGRQTSTITIEIPNISKLSSELKSYSNYFWIRGLKWRLYARRCKFEDDDDFLGLFLEKYWGKLFKGNNFFLYNVTFTFTILTWNSWKKEVTKSFKPVDIREGGAYGTSRLLPFSELVNSQKGYLKNDEISIRVSIHTNI